VSAVQPRISGKVRTKNRHVVAIMGSIVTGISDSARDALITVGFEKSAASRRRAVDRYAFAPLLVARR